MKFTATLGLLLLIGSVAHAQSREHTLTIREGDGCHEERVPMAVRGAISLVNLELNGKPVSFIVDSAGTTMINSDRVTLRAVEQLNLGSITVDKTAPLAPWDVVKIASLKLGKVEFRDIRVLSRSLPHLEKQLGSEVDGILGADLLTRWDAVALDYRHGTLRLGRTSCTETHEEPLPPPPQTLGFRRP